MTPAETAAHPRRDGVIPPSHGVAAASGRRRVNGFVLDSALPLSVLIAIGVIVALPRVAHGGLSYDDWQFASTVRFSGVSDAFTQFLQLNPRRPVTAFYFAFLNGTLGLGAHAQLAWSAGVRIATACAFFLVLRELRVEAATALGTALLLLLFPWSDSTWMWIAGSASQLSTLLLLLGAFASLRSGAGARPLWLFALGLLLYSASVMTYEVTLPAAMAAALLSFIRLPRRMAVRRAAAHVVIIGCVAVFVSLRVIPLLHGHDSHATGGLSASLHHAKVIADQGLSLATEAIVPFGGPHRNIVLPLLLLVVVAACLLAWRTRLSWLRTEARLGFLLVLGGALLLPLSYLSFVAADIYYVPLQVGVGNRVNALGAAGFALVVAGGARLAGVVAFGWHARERRLAVLASVAAIITIGVGYAHRTSVDRGNWNEATAQSQAALTALRRLVIDPSAGSTILADGFPLFAAPGIPVFAASWDLNGAVKLAWNDASLSGDPLPPMVCGAHAARLDPGVNSVLAAPMTVPYGRLYVANVAQHRSIAVRDRQSCLAGRNL